MNIVKLYQVLTSTERRHALGLLVCMLVSSLIELTGFLSILPLVALAADPEHLNNQPWLKQLYDISGAQSFRSFFLSLAAGFVVLFSVAQVAHAVTAWLSDRLSYTVRHRLTVLLLERYLAKPYLWLSQRNSSELMKAVLDDVDRLVNDNLLVVLTMCRRSFIIAGIAAALIWLEPLLTLGALFFYVCLYWMVYGVFRRKIVELGEAHHQVNNRRFKAVQEGLASVQEGRVHFRRQHLVENYRNLSWRSSLMLARYHLLKDTPNRLGHILGITSIVGVLAYFAYRGDSATALPTLTAFILGIWKLAPELQALYRDSSRLRFDQPVLNNLYTELLGEAPIEVPSETVTPLSLGECLELKSVCFSYPEAPTPAIQDVSAKVPRGTSVGLVGVTGAGKTTLADLIGGFLSPQSGQILVDGKSIEGQSGWQRNIGYVPQSVYLSDDTVSRNIALGLPDEMIEQEAVEKAACLAGIHTFIQEELPQQYQSVLGERGVCLSGGQCQRIGIARALYHDPELLILDEATSSLDNLTERAVMSALRDLTPNKTLLVIAHRLSTVEYCDQIWFFEQGRLVERGSFAELQSRSEDFRRLTESKP